MTEKKCRKAVAILRDLGWEAIEPLTLGDNHGVSARRRGSDTVEEFWDVTGFQSKVLYGWSTGEE